jgi:DNA repair protein RadC
MENANKLSINKWAEEDRPREKMLMKGAEALSDAELFAILIGSGNQGESAVELMRRILDSCSNDLNSLARWDIHDFSRFKGMGPAKSLTLMAALEIGRRRAATPVRERKAVRCSKDIYDIFRTKLMDLPYEEFWVLLLNQSNKVIDTVRVSSGGIAGTYVDVRLVLREALLRHATQIAVVHNHPSGNNQPSSEDRSLTQRISKASETMNIRLLDHVIICESCYYSFADEGML